MRSRPLLLPILAGCALALALGLVGCRQAADDSSSSAQGETRPQPVRVVASTPMVAELVREVGGGGVQVEVLLPADTPVSSLQRTGPAESRLIGADLIVLLGFDQEAVLAPSVARATDAGAVVCELASGMPPDRLLRMPDAPDQIDPAVWMDPGLWREAVKPIEEALARLRPEWAAEWRNRAHAARFDLEEAGRAMEGLARIAVPADAKPTRTAHTGLRYAARAAGVPVDIATDSAPAPRKDDLESLKLDFLRPPGTKAIAGIYEHDLGTVDGLRSYALELLLRRWQ